MYNAQPFAEPRDWESGNVNPSATLPALLSYIQPAFDHIIRSPTNNLSKALAVDVSYHIGITLRCTTTLSPVYPRRHLHPLPQHPPYLGVVPAPGHDFYDRTGEYSVDVARELLLSALPDSLALVHTALPPSRTVLHLLLHRRVVHQPSAELCEPPVRQARPRRG
jgi:hypothetical protein